MSKDPTKLTFEKVEKKLRIAADLFKLAYDVKRFQLAQKHPELDEIQINHKAYALIKKGCA